MSSSLGSSVNIGEGRRVIVWNSESRVMEKSSDVGLERGPKKGVPDKERELPVFSRA